MSRKFRQTKKQKRNAQISKDNILLEMESYLKCWGWKQIDTTDFSRPNEFADPLTGMPTRVDIAFITQYDREIVSLGGKKPKFIVQYAEIPNFG